MSAGVYVCELEPGDVTPMGVVTDVERISDHRTTVEFDGQVKYRYGSALTVVTVFEEECQWVGLSPDGETACHAEPDAGRYCTKHAAVARSYRYDEAVINR